MRLAESVVSLSLVALLSACSGSESSNPPTGITENTGTTTTGTGMEDDPDPVAEFPPIYATAEGIAQCSVDDLKARVDFDMRDYYIYYDQVPTLNLADYDSASDLIRDLRVAPDIYSSVRDASTTAALFNEGETSGYGIWFQPDAAGVIRFRYIRFGSPADDAGIMRGDELITFNGKPIREVTGEELNATLRQDVEPLTLTVRTADEEPREVVISSAVYRWFTAGPSATFSAKDPASTLPKVGYLPVRSFLETTRGEIDNALQGLRNAGDVKELIVDLRYNGGGRTSVARRLASLVGGTAVVGKLAYSNEWNDKYSFYSDQINFPEVTEPFNFSRVFVLTTGSTASASEIFINALKPYIEVVVIGDTTSGKPFTSNSRTYCDKSISAMRSVRENSVGVSVAGGLQADCIVEDDWATIANSGNDPLVGGVLQFLSKGTCNTAPITAVSQRSYIDNGPTYKPADSTQNMAEE